MSTKTTNGVVNSHRTHYLKWEFLSDSNFSIRYNFLFQARPTLEGKFTLKNHDNSTLVELEPHVAEYMIANLTSGKVEEIVGYRRNNGTYVKKHLKNGQVYTFIEKGDKVAATAFAKYEELFDTGEAQ